MCALIFETVSRAVLTYSNTTMLFSVSKNTLQTSLKTSFGKQFAHNDADLS